MLHCNLQCNKSMGLLISTFTSTSNFDFWQSPNPGQFKLKVVSQNYFTHGRTEPNIPNLLYFAQHRLADRLRCDGWSVSLSWSGKGPTSRVRDPSRVLPHSDDYFLRNWCHCPCWSVRLLWRMHSAPLQLFDEVIRDFLRDCDYSLLCASMAVHEGMLNGKRWKAMEVTE